MKQDFYRAFEDRHRGSRELIKSRLEVYLPFVLPLAALYPGAPAIDVGCGRGEWLELLGDHGIPAEGVDLDEGMLAACRERGMRVTQGDAVAYLQALPEASCILVTGFHIAEHLPFDVLQALVGQALRVLKPGGLLVLETPNPENLTVGATNFYIDPTHIRPLPPLLMEFLPEFHGYGRTKLLRLQGNPALMHSNDVSLGAVLAGVSPDYAVVAQKTGLGVTPADADARRALDLAFAVDIGFSLADLANRHDQQQARGMAVVQEARSQVKEGLQWMQQMVQGMHALHVVTEGVRAENVAAREHFDRSLQAAYEARVVAERAQAQAHELSAQLRAVYESRSWRITEPLRWAMRVARALCRPRTTAVNVSRRISRRLSGFINARPRLRELVGCIAAKLGLEKVLGQQMPQIVELANPTGPGDPPDSGLDSPRDSGCDGPSDADLEDLSQDARAVYSLLVQDMPNVPEKR